jgi:proline iminopeptidase
MSKKPYKKGYLQVSSLHRIYFEAWGNPKGTPFVFLHGGPGNGFRDKDKDKFDLKKDFVILFDQRGSGRSKPFNEFKQNTTKDLLSDISSLLQFFKIDKAVMYGRSWGSTLALLYAIQNHKKVLGLVIGGIFLASKKEYKYIFDGLTVTHFPEAWNNFISAVPLSSRKNIVSFYFNKITKTKGKEKQKWVTNWNFYFNSLSLLGINEGDLSKFSKQYNPACLIEMYYTMNDFFLTDNYLLKNLSKIKHLPVEIEHGRYDFLCLPEIAYKVHKNLPKSNLRWSFAGHYGSEAIKENMKQALKSIRKRLSKKSK